MVALGALWGATGSPPVWALIAVAALGAITGDASFTTMMFTDRPCQNYRDLSAAMADGLADRLGFKNAEALYLADDRRGNPTPVDDAARVILAVLKQLDCQVPLWGTYHYGGHEASTPLLVAQALLGEASKYRDVTTANLTAVAHAACSDAAAEPQHGVLVERRTQPHRRRPAAGRKGARFCQPVVPPRLRRGLDGRAGKWAAVAPFVCPAFSGHQVRSL